MVFWAQLPTIPQSDTEEIEAFAIDFPHFNREIPGPAPFLPLPAVSSQCSCGTCTSHSLFLVLSTLIPNLLSPQDTGNDTLLTTTTLRGILGTSLR